MPLSTDPLVFARDANNDLIVPLRRASGVEAVEILVRARLKLWRGEWHLDPGAGMPWLETGDGAVTEQDAILGQAFDAAKTAAAVRAMLLGNAQRAGVPGVVEITELRTAFDGETRNLTISCVARTEFGDTAPIEVALAA